MVGIVEGISVREGGGLEVKQRGGKDKRMCPFQLIHRQIKTSSACGETSSFRLPQSCRWRVSLSSMFAQTTLVLTMILTEKL
jgi:hypothetical protein